MLKGGGVSTTFWAIEFEIDTRKSRAETIYLYIRDCLEIVNITNSQVQLQCQKWIEW